MTRQHAFVAMPFGTKRGPDGQDIDFNRIYEELIRPALEAADLEVFRADEESRAGEIRRDMFQELLVADLVVADLTLDNPNVWYELGVRHALRARGVVLVQGPRAGQPFDIYTERKLRYGLAGAVPDPATLAADRARITRMARDTLDAPSRREVSPVYQLLPHLEPPVWRRLLMEGHNEFRQVYEPWAARMEAARRRQLPGDILVLAEETPTRALRLEALRAAGDALLKLRQYRLALEQFEAALEVEPLDKAAAEKRCVCLGRLGRRELAREAARALVAARPRDAEAWALAGRMDKETWMARWWREEGGDPADPSHQGEPQLGGEALRAAAAAADACLEQAVATYRRAFALDPAHCYAGINALTLMSLRQSLGGDVAVEDFKRLRGGVRWACASAAERDDRDYWARATCAEWALLNRPRKEVAAEFRRAAALADRDWFALDSTRQQLLMLQRLGWRPAETAAALDVLEAEMAQSTPPFVPQRVLLFSGHMVDAPGRSAPRFPAQKVAAAQRRIEQALDALAPGAQDLALCQAAAGGDLLFLEACLARGVRCQVLLPFDEPEFIRRSVEPVSEGDRWRERYHALRRQLPPPRLMPTELGPLPAGANAFERCNLWLLYTALAHGPEKVHFFCLWNGEEGDGRGGTAHMRREVQSRTGHTHWIDTRTLE
jgi:tetratricopeptide (TPR) repeat protein